MRVLSIALLIMALAWTEASAAIRVDMQTAAAATADGKSMSVDDKGAAGLTVTGTFTATVTFEGSADGGTTWTALSCIRLSTVVATTTTTTTGQFVCNVGGLSHLRARVSAYTNGSVTVVGTPSMASTAGAGAGTSGLTFDANGNLNVNLNTLLSCEDQTNSLCMISGGAVRGTEGNIINSAVGDATSAAFALPTGYKTITGRITGAGAVAQVITIYGGTSSGMVAATSDVVCTITLSGTSGAAGTAYSCPPFIAPFLFYRVVTSGSSGTPTTILTASY